MKLPPAMIALVLASKLDLKENESQKIECPKCEDQMDVYKTVTGKLTGRCENCGLVLPKS